MLALVAVPLRLPPELALPLAIFGVSVLAVGLGWMLLRWLGWRRALAALAVVLIYLGVMLARASSLDRTELAAAAEHGARLVAIRQELARLSGAAPQTTLRAACQARPSGLAIEQFGLVYRYGLSGNYQRLVGFRWHDGAVVDREWQLEEAAPGTLMSSWLSLVVQPWRYNETPGDRGPSPLAAVRLAVVVVGGAASLFDLTIGGPVCEGRLDAELRTDDPNMRPRHLGAIAPVCHVVTQELCAAAARPVG